MTSQIQAKISNPTDYFDTPQSVLNDDGLTRNEKIKVLQSMALDADQILDSTSEGMLIANKVYNANNLQSALVQLEKARSHVAVYDSNSQKSRFQKVIVVTTVDQDLRRDIADVAYDIAEVAGGKVCLLSVVPFATVSSSIAVGSMGAAAPIVTTDSTRIIDDRNQQLAELSAQYNSKVKTEIEVRSGQIEDVIVEYADDCSADLIVVGSPNRSWFETLLTPSIAGRITRSAPCPILVVPEAA